ncbi:pogo transposable element with ZNF domain isoform X5 [Conger conger]|uniref:pogo transposable element with ZNF domain isoform X5 n=1 Tax=Conger conger TaxID=82655 RepID=UPI002A59DBB7|nr:pogo transposable element with ZNF domain isoform X5 [Conger conger]
MADADLFMECEEEELEPWQQMNDDVEDEEVGIVENKTSTAPLSVVSPGPSSMTLVPPLATPVALPIMSTPLIVSSATVPSDGKKPMVSLFTSAASPVSSVLSPSVAPQGLTHSVSSLVPPGLHKPAPGQQLFLTQSPGGLSTVAMSQMLQPMHMMSNAAPGPGAANNQPIFFTQDIPPTHSQRPVGHAFPHQYSMGFPVRNVRPVQNSVNPLGIVLNVQQGQTVRPITLLSAPGTPFFKPAVGVPQVMPQVMPQAMPQVMPQAMRPGNPAAVHPPTSSYTTVQIPATLTIRSTTPLTQPLTTMAATQPLPSPGPPSNLPPKIGSMSSETGRSRRFLMQGDVMMEVQEPGDHEVNVCNLVAVKHGDGNPDVQKLVNMVSTVSPPTVAQPQTLQVVMANTNGPTNGLNSALAASPLDSIKVGPATSVPTYNVCPRCGAQFRMVEALRGHMCFCCPEMNLKLSEGQKPMTTKSAPAPRPPLTPPKPTQTSIAPSPQLADRSPSTDSQGKLIMLVDDFYYGVCEGLRSRASSDVREQGLFKCLSCAKRLKNNIRLMNHMKHHVELDQQNGEVDTHTNCQHCYRQFPTPFQLQCHLESVHSHYESTTKCKICEWAFESEPVFLQHMKNTHKPGEMPYVCQVCEYRSSFYTDVYNHFRTWHEDTRNLLCHYCLKVFKNSNAYQQHYIRHQKKTVYHCNKCRLQFLFTKDKVDHKINHHKTFRKPKQLEGLMPGTKVTIRAYAVQTKGTRQPPVAPPMVPPMYLPAPTGRDTPSPQVGRVVPKPLLIQTQNKPQTTVKKRSVSKMLELLTKFQEQRATLGKQLCLECNFEVPDFPNHYPTYVHCSLCHYGTCCSRAYANHMIINHVPRSTHRYLTMYKKFPPSGVKLDCSSCTFVTGMGDEMAKHLIQNPSHSYSLCTRIEQLESDIENSDVEEEEPGGEGGSAVEVLWNPDSEAMGSSKKILKSTVPDFTDVSGPYHSLSKTSDAIDYFHLLFPISLLEVITQETNAYAMSSQVMGQADPDWKPVTVAEIQGFMGLSILMGLQSLPETDMYWSWQHCESCLTFLKTMPAKRFHQISAHIRVCSENSNWPDGPPDRLRMIRPLLEVVEDTIWETYHPKKCLTIDQALLTNLEVDCSEEKQSTGQMQVWLLCDSKSGYCHRILIETQQDKPKGGDPGFRVVLPLLKGLQGKNHQVFLASSLTSFPLMQKLLDQDIYCCSSFPPHSPMVPKEFWEQGQLKHSGEFLQQLFGPVLVTRWQDSKEMCCLSTNAEPGLPDTVWRKSQVKAGELCPIQRPEAFRLLQENMRGVDICNQLQACNPLGGLIRDTWWRCLFWHLLNLSIVNSFILLRESRKDTPPLWVQGSRFSQAKFRKRLGHQLAKCPQRGVRRLAAERWAAASGEGGGEGGAVRHRLVKITAKTKRCKNCSVKNLRHETVFGCIACRVNLCKGSRCFWEYHGLSPHNRVPPRVGFTMQRQGLSPVKNSRSQPSYPLRMPTLASSSKWEPETLDQEMAPVEDLDTDTEEEQEECPVDEQGVQGTGIKKESVHMDGPNIVPEADGLGGVKEREETLSVRQLRIVLFALCCGIAQAAEHFSTQTGLIHTWLQEKERQMDRERRGGGGEAVERLVEWVLAQREQQLPVNEKNLFQKASEIHSHANQGSSFRISYEWAVSFMLQHDLGLQTTCTVSRRLPRNTEESARAFTEFVHKQNQAQNFSLSVIGAMDELSIFVDLDLLADPATVGKEPAFQLVGTGESLIDIFLATLADGTLLPTMVFFKGQLPGRLRTGVPNSILLEAKVEGFTEEEEMDLWTSQVWQKHMKSQGGGKGMLIMDSFRGHLTDDSLATLSAASTLPTIVPAGCTCRLQPLEMCLRPVLLRFLLARWTKLAAQGGAAGASPKELVQLLVAWLVEALAPLSDQPELLRRSFHVASVLSGTESQNTHAEAQMELVNTFSEILLGSHVAELVSPAEEGMVTSKEAEKPLNSVDEKRTPEVKVEVKEDKKESDTEVKEAEKLLEVQGAEKMNILDTSQQGMV